MAFNYLCVATPDIGDDVPQFDILSGLRWGQSLHFTNNKFRPIAGDEISFARLPQSLSRTPKRCREKTDNQSEESCDGLPVLFEERSGTGLSSSQRSEDLGNTFFRLIVGAFVIGLLHALVKRIRKPNNKYGNHNTRNGDNP